MNFGNPFGSVPQAGMQNWYGAGDYMSGGVSTNVYKVTSLQEAITRSNARPSETVYFNQDKPEFYNVRVDVAGNKTWQTFVYNTPAMANENAQISRSEFDELAAKVAALEGKQAEVTENG